MELKPIENIHHLVHVGFNPADHPEFQKTIKDYIDEVKRNLSDVIVFVQEPLENLHDLTNTFSKCISAALYDDFLDGAYFDRITRKHPPEVIKDIMDEFPNEIAILRTGKSRAEYECEQAVAKIKGTSLPFLTQLRAKYQNKNIYRHHSSDNKSILPQNPKRFADVLAHAYHKLGEERIFFTMMDRSMKRLVLDDIGPCPEFCAEDKILYGAYDQLKVQWRKRTKQNLLKNYTEKGREVRDTTKHIVGGENWGECVFGYEKMLYNVFQYDKDQITKDPKISWLPVGD